MENQPYRAFTRLPEAPSRWFTRPEASRAESFTAVDLLTLEKPSPAPSVKPAPAPPPVCTAQVVKHLTVMEALASQTRLSAIELCLNG